MHLKPCKCGREPYSSVYTSEWTGEKTYHIQCRPCMAHATGMTEAEAVENWNNDNLEYGIFDFGAEGPPGIRGPVE